MPQVTKVIVKHYGVLAESEKGWTKELNLVSWNGRDPRLDIREWAPDKNKTGKGVTIKQAEFGVLKSIVNSIDMSSDISKSSFGDAAELPSVFKIEPQTAAVAESADIFQAHEVASMAAICVEPIQMEYSEA